MIQLSPVNSTGGPGAHPKRYALPGWHAADEIMQTAYEAHAEDHGFVQPGTLVRTVMDDAGGRLADNTVAHCRDAAHGRRPATDLAPPQPGRHQARAHRKGERTMGLSWHQVPLAPDSIGRFLVPGPLPERLLYAEPQGLTTGSVNPGRQP